MSWPASRYALERIEIDGAVHRNPVEPCAEIGAGLEPAQLPVRLEKRLLDDIFRVLRSAGHPVRKTVDGPAVTVHERPESFAIAVAGQRDSGGVRLRHPSRLDGAWGWGLAAIRSTCYVRRGTTPGARKAEQSRPGAVWSGGVGDVGLV